MIVSVGGNPNFGVCVRVGVFVSTGVGGVPVTVAVGGTVGVRVGVLVGVRVGVIVNVGVLLGVEVRAAPLVMVGVRNFGV